MNVTELSGTRMIDVLAQHLSEEGIDTVFGIPGGLLYPFFHHVERDSAFNLIVTKHEEAAAFMADGYARASGRPAVAAATAGPGATNLITGVAAAFADGVPMVVLTGQASSFHLGKGASQESWREDIDIVGMMRPITKYSAMVISPDHISRHFRRAMRLATSGRPGPVHLNIPVDYWNHPVDETWFQPRTYRTVSTPVDPHAVGNACQALAAADRPVLLVGSGARSPGARQAVRQLAEALGVPVATTPRAKGVFPEDHQLSVGIFGFAGHSSAKQAVFDPGSDLLLTIGASLNETTTLNWDPAVTCGKVLIQVDIDPERIGRNFPIDHGIVADAEVAARAILNHLRATGSHDAAASRRAKPILPAFGFNDEDLRASLAVPLAPQRWRAELMHALPEDAVLVSDIGGHMLFNLHHLRLGEGNDFLLNLGFGSMGHGTTAPIGAKLARPDRPVIAIIGDACFTMNGMDLLTAREYDIPVVWIVEDNAQHGITHHASKRLSAGRPLHCVTYRQPPDIADIASSMGLVTWRVDRPGQMSQALKEAIAANTPAVIHVTVDPEISPPVGDRVDTVAGFKGDNPPN
ncbi:thiamine pyrophosphate-binding protein [Streptomyces sp. NPDC058701]|uniref:thiamine pyrophosphate-binding protein n=1 Tax=Streptomyces sp. NPDC058701 TaxID=3346608 RepID=UPI0036559A18